jgi:transcriptional regulator with XRE-family HTH domain
MKSITEMIGGTQGPLDISYDLQGCFEEYLGSEKYNRISQVENGIIEPSYEFLQRSMDVYNLSLVEWISIRNTLSR